MKPRQPVFFKVPNPTNESKDEEKQNIQHSVGSTERFFVAFPE